MDVVVQQLGHNVWDTSSIITVSTVQVYRQCRRVEGTSTNHTGMPQELMEFNVGEKRIKLPCVKTVDQLLQNGMESHV